MGHQGRAGVKDGKDGEERWMFVSCFNMINPIPITGTKIDYKTTRAVLSLRLVWPIDGIVQNAYIGD